MLRPGEQAVFDKKLAQALARRLADDRAAIDVAHGRIPPDGVGRLDRAALVIDNDERRHSQTTDQFVQYLCGIRFARDVHFSIGHAKFLQAATRQLLIAAGAFARVHEELGHAPDYT